LGENVLGTDGTRSILCLGYRASPHLYRGGDANKQNRGRKREDEDTIRVFRCGGGVWGKCGVRVGFEWRGGVGRGACVGGGVRNKMLAAPGCLSCRCGRYCRAWWCCPCVLWGRPRGVVWLLGRPSRRGCEGARNVKEAETESEGGKCRVTPVGKLAGGIAWGKCVPRRKKLRKKERRLVDRQKGAARVKTQ